MSFSQYKTLGSALREFQIARIYEPFVVPVPTAVSEYLRQEMEFMQRRVNFTASEFAVCENLVYPILKDVWKPYEEFQIWSHTSINYNQEFTGTPDYFLARSSPLGTPVVEEPYLMVVEAKQDDFDWGWGQCLAAMVAAHKLNQWPEQVMYGITTNGLSWQFGKLHAGRFTQDPKSIDWLPLDGVCAAVNFMFEQCQVQLAGYAGAA